MIDIVAGGTVDLNEYDIDPKRIKRIWTVYHEPTMWNSTNFDPQTGKEIKNKTLDDLHLKHHEGVFLEDYVHDWNVREEHILHYYTRVFEDGEKTKILIELERSEIDE